MEFSFKDYIKTRSEEDLLLRLETMQDNMSLLARIIDSPFFEADKEEFVAAMHNLQRYSVMVEEELSNREKKS